MIPKTGKSGAREFTRLSRVVIRKPATIQGAMVVGGRVRAACNSLFRGRITKRSRGDHFLAMT